MQLSNPADRKEMEIEVQVGIVLLLIRKPANDEKSQLLTTNKLVFHIS